MEIGDWITLAAVIVALGIGVASIIQTQKLQNNERRAKLLNEIIEWVVDVYKCGLEKEMPDIFRITNENEGKLHLAISLQILARSFQSMRGRNKYISKIVPSFGNNLYNATNDLIKDMEAHISLLDTLYNVVTLKYVSITEQNKTEYQTETMFSCNQIAIHKNRLDDSANKVIDEVSKLKAQDIRE